MGYAVIRFVVEFLRADNAPIYWGMAISQVFSIIIAAAGLIAFFARRSRCLSKPHARLFPETQ